MGMIGRWIDSQDADAKDRIIMHPDPSYEGSAWWDSRRDCGCLVGCTVPEDGWVSLQWGIPVAIDRPADINWPYPAHLIKGSGFPELLDIEDTRVGTRFPRLTERFSAPRMWRLVKARAARGNQVVLPAVTEEAAVA